MSYDRAGTCIYHYENPNINADQISDGGTLTTLAFGQIPVFGPIILTLESSALHTLRFSDGLIMENVR